MSKTTASDALPSPGGDPVFTGQCVLAALAGAAFFGLNQKDGSSNYGEIRRLFPCSPDGVVDAALDMLEGNTLVKRYEGTFFQITPLGRARVEAALSARTRDRHERADFMGQPAKFVS